MDVFAENAGTIVTAVVLGVIVFFIIRKIVKDARGGCSFCGGSCASCKGRCGTHGRNPEKSGGN